MINSFAEFIVCGFVLWCLWVLFLGGDTDDIY